MIPVPLAHLCHLGDVVRKHREDNVLLCRVAHKLQCARHRENVRHCRGAWSEQRCMYSMLAEILRKKFYIKISFVKLLHISVDSI